MLAENGEHEAAVELMEQALELVPDWPAGLVRLADYAEKANQPEKKAVPALQRALELDPQDIFGARLKLALLGAEAVPTRRRRVTSRRVFDDYADRFDTALVERLDYTVPAKAPRLIADHDDRRFEVAVDLGAARGSSAPRSAIGWTRLEGFDLSVNMLAKAEERASMTSSPRPIFPLIRCNRASSMRGLAEGRADLVSAADVLMYLGDLANAFSLAARLARPGARFAFSVEDAGEGEGYCWLRACVTPNVAPCPTASCRKRLRGPHLDPHHHSQWMAEKPVSGILFLASRIG